MAEGQSQDTEIQAISNINDVQRNPYYLHPGESPVAVLVTPPMDETNYHTWSRSMKRALRSKNKYKFIDETISSGISQSTIYIDKTQELWEDLKERYSKGDYFRMLDVLQELHSIKQGDRGISGYHTNIKILWDEFDSLRHIASCMCEIKCRCGLVGSIKDQRGTKYVICFLKGLNDDFSTIRAQILMMEPLSSMNKAFSIVLQQERQLLGSTSLNPKILFNAVSNKPQAIQESQTQSWRPRNTFGRSNHASNRGRGSTRSYGGNKPSRVKMCSFYGRERHTIETGYFKRDLLAKMQQNRTRPPTTSINTATKDEGNDQEGGTMSFNFESKQYAQLASIFKSIGVGNSEHNVNQLSLNSLPASDSNLEPVNQKHEIIGKFSTWTLDTGATDHVCPNLINFDVFQSIKPIVINLPNGATTLDMTTSRMIGHAEVKNNVYVLRKDFEKYIANKHNVNIIYNKTPYELLCDKQANLLETKVFECLCFASTLVQQRTKLDPMAMKCIFLGHRPGTKGYAIFDLQTRDTFTSRHVIIYEHLPTSTSQNETSASHSEAIPEQTPSHHATPNIGTSNLNQDASTIQNPRRSNRLRNPPTYLKDFDCHLFSTNNFVVTHLLSFVLSYHSISPAHLGHILSISARNEPKHYNQAITSYHWIEAMQNELNALEVNKTWSLVDLPPNKKAIGCK
ncbi:PREDICTED: uncharacterized protein LOC109344577 [Lupinus angustifolius]|uniref:uncharacterized protein LOC109344577 n=1 Tax=Lupinus angustifolius TaxID=3871 RepID=UPI00092EB146|nr:PREDICTED: uncharacterized protein LOC109344577 [Lupinus angustifolius]